MQPSCTLQEPPCAPSTMASLPSLFSLPSSLSGLPSTIPSLPSLFSLPSSLSGLPSSLPSLASPLPSSLVSLQGHLGEKQLFEKFWKGTFKAVATPRPESVIVASITARTRLASTETSVCRAVSVEERKGEDTDGRVVISDRRRCIRDKKRKHGCRRRPRSLSLVGDMSPRPPPKGKRKKRKSERRRKRKRSPSYSLSPLRKKKKKKKKKSSKKSKRHRCSSKKNKHSSSSLKRKRREDRKQKKSSRSHSHHKRRCRRSESDSSACRSSSAESRSHLDRSALREVATATLEHRGHPWGPTAKSVCKTAPSHRFVLSTGTSLPAKPGVKTLNAKGIHHHTLPPPSKGPQDYDSGNDTSSPPSTKTGVSRVNGTGDKRILCPALASLEKQKFPEGDNASDSGNSVTSYASLCKTLRVEGGLVSFILNRNCKSSEPMTPRCGATVAVRTQQNAVSPARADASSPRRTRGRSSSSRSRSRSSGRSRRSGRRYSRSRSPSSARSYSRSVSYSGSVRRRGSVGSGRSSRSYSTYSPDSRVREQRRRSSSRERDGKSSRKSTRKRHRRKSYSPMRKRRRDSPSHLEARRITSARKRPIPYFRPSPSSSSRSGSLSLWSSLFTRSPSRGRSLSRGRSDSSYRSYSRSSSWNSIFGGRSRSRSRCRSYVSLDEPGKARR
ncbi:serine/arginine repetitive matrix protein 4 isoform X1 [Osmerus eperlanus]|uniref:serine/arginine repetitive matrix protein 4 isoform X1 n=1 Tax=Osmerus eperlanus TaxID=29151 RepID=UPI002E11983B